MLRHVRGWCGAVCVLATSIAGAGCPVEKAEQPSSAQARPLDEQWDELSPSEREAALLDMLEAELARVESGSVTQEEWEASKAVLVDALSGLRALMWEERRAEYLELEERVEALIEDPPLAG